ncbi:MAG TPA: alpha/beta fold hydrolase [Terriglobales bacterium]
MSDSPPFRPPWWLRNGHANTVYSFLRPRGVRLPPGQADWLPVGGGVELLLRSHWQPSAAPALLVVHGLEGSSEAGYMLTTARFGLEAGFHVIRMNVRGCGEAEARCPALYNSGLSGDVAAAVAWVAARPLVTAVALIGYSMGGNLVLKYAGECGGSPHAALTSVAAVSPCLDLDACATALHRKVNYFYERRFLAGLKRRLRRDAARHPGRYPVEKLDGMGSVREFDDIITGPFTGYRDADDYYQRASAARVLDAIRVPTLILHSEDDPFIVITAASRRACAANPAIRFEATAHGGHCAFINSRRAGAGIYWGEGRVVEFSRACQAAVGAADPAGVIAPE